METKDNAIAGTALGLLNGGLGNLFGGTTNAVSKYDLEQAEKLNNKDMQIAILTSESNTDKKLVEVYEAINSKVNGVIDLVRSNKDEQNAINMQQVAYNATNTATIGCVQNQVNQLMAMTKMVIPNSSVCPGWGNVTITPSTTTTTA